MRRSQSLGGCVYNPAVHRVIRSAWLETVKRRARLAGCTFANRVFLYRHADTGAFIVACWNPERQGGFVRSFVALESMELSPDRQLGWGQRPSIQYMLARLRPAAKVAREASKQMKNEVTAFRALRELQKAKKDEWLSYMKKRNADLYREVKRGAIPVAFPEVHNPDRSRQVYEMLRRAGRR